jgi:hypothetical protein
MRSDGGDASTTVLKSATHWIASDPCSMPVRSQVLFVSSSIMVGNCLVPCTLAGVAMPYTVQKNCHKMHVSNGLKLAATREA